MTRVAVHSKKGVCMHVCWSLHIQYTLLYVLLIVICYIFFSWGKGNDRHSDGRHSRKHWQWVDMFSFSFGLFVSRYDRNKSGSNASQPAGSHETLGVWWREVMLGSLLIRLEDGFLVPLHSSPPIVGSAQRVMFADFGKARDRHDSFTRRWCQELPLPWHQVWAGST